MVGYLQWLERWKQRQIVKPAAGGNLLERQLQWLLVTIEPSLDGYVLPVRDLLLTQAPSMLVELDQRMRSHRRPRADDLPDDMLDRLTRFNVDPSTREAGRFLMSMHWSGHSRERAIRELETSASRLALAASLIRAADWVDAVRYVATDIAERLIERCAEDDVFAMMPLAFRMRRHMRFDVERIHGKLEAWLTSKDERIDRALAEPFAPVRRWAFSLLLTRSATMDSSLLNQAINDSDPTIAMIGFRLLDDLSGDTRRSLIETGLKAKHPVIRQVALRAMARDMPAVPLDILHGALVDRSMGMRSFAAYTLRVQHQADPADIWREQIDSGRALPAAALSLAELASPDDEARLRSILCHADARSRAAALRSLVKLGMRVTDEAFLRFATDPSRRVIRVLAMLCRKGDIALDTHRMQLVWTAVPGQAASILTELLDALPTGEREDRLLTFEPATDIARAWWNAMLAAWSAQALGWWEPSTQLRRRLADLLARQSMALTASLRDSFEHAV